MPHWLLPHHHQSLRHWKVIKVKVACRHKERRKMSRFSFTKRLKPWLVFLSRSHGDGSCLFIRFDTHKLSQTLNLHSPLSPMPLRLQHKPRPITNTISKTMLVILVMITIHMGALAFGFRVTNLTAQS